MTTINGVTFNMKTLEPVGTHRNVPNEEIGTDESFISDMGYSGLVLRMTGYEKTLAKYDEVINEFMKPGGHTLVYRTGWQFTVYSTQLVPLLDIGIVDNFFPYELMMITSNPYRHSTTQSCRAVEITSNNQEWYHEDMACTLLNNWSFENWAAGPSAAPDYWWDYDLLSISRTSTNYHGSYALEMEGNSAASVMGQYIDAKYKGKQVTVGLLVKSSYSDTARIGLSDGADKTRSAYHTGGGGWEWLTVTHTFGYAPYLFVELLPDVESAIFDCAVLVEGDSIPDHTFLRYIDTDGSVDTIPNIQVTGGAAASTYNRESGYSDTNTDPAEYSNSNTSWTLEKTHTFTAESHYGWILNTVGLDVESCSSSYTGSGKVTYQAASLNGGSETDVPGASWSKINPGYSSFSVTDLDIQCAGNEDLVVRFYLKSASGLACANFKNLDYDILASRKDVCKNPQVYNIADTTVKCDVGNEIEPDMKVIINTDGTGSIEYADRFDTDKYLDAFWEKSGVTHDTSDDELDIADDGYICYKMDCKYPVTGIPTLTSRINVTAGTPTIQISSDGITWYDIDTAISSGGEIIYNLDSTSLHIKENGLTEFYWRIDCVKAGAATCTIVHFKLNVAIVTIDIEHPSIAATGEPNTFGCDQHADSGLNCVVTLNYRDRSWAA